MWSERDYIVHGRYCDTATLQQALASVCATVGAQSATLIAYQGGTLFQSLLLVTDRDDGRATHSGVSPQETLLRSQVSLTANEFDALTARDGAALVTALAGRAPFSEASARLGWDRVSCDFVQPPASELGATSTCIIFGRPEDLPAHDTMERINTMVNATPAISLYQDYLLSELIEGTHDTAEDRHESVDPVPGRPARQDVAGGPYSAYARDILDAALELTRSSAGNIYLTSSRRHQLVLAAQRNNDNAPLILPRNKRNSVVAWVYRRRRALLINDLSDFKRTHPDIGFMNAHPSHLSPYAELAVPIRQRHIGSAEPRLFGVLNVEKVDGIDLGPYTYRDLAILQQLAERFLLFRSNALLRLSSESLARLTRVNSAAASGSLPSYDPVRARQRTKWWRRIPIEFIEARASVEEILDDAHLLTHSMTTTVWLANPSGFALQRFCAFPRSSMNDMYPLIRVDDSSSVNAWVARYGRECYIADLTADNSFAEYEGLDAAAPARKSPPPRSELCLPLFVKGRLVGTMNFESVLPDGYNETIAVAQAVAEQVALQLTYARRAHEDVVVSLNASATVSTHELGKVARRLESSAEAGHDVGPRQLASLADDIRACLSRLTPAPDPAEVSVQEVLDRSIRRTEMLGQVRCSNVPVPGPGYPGHVASALQAAFVELLVNAASASINSERYGVEIEFSERMLGGVRFHRVEFRNHVLDPLPNWSTYLYRVPFAKLPGKRLHLGAFVAGALVRWIGGDVYRAPSPPNVLSTIVDIPVGGQA